MKRSSTCPLPGQSSRLAQPDRPSISSPSVRPRNAAPSPVTRQGMQKKHVRHSPPPQNLNEINRLGTLLSHRCEGVSGAGVAAWSRRAIRARSRLSGPPLSQGAHDTTVLRKQGQEPPHPLLGGVAEGRGGFLRERQHVRTHPAATRHKEETCPALRAVWRARFLFPSKEGICCVLPPGFPVSMKLACTQSQGARVNVVPSLSGVRASSPHRGHPGRPPRRRVLRPSPVTNNQQPDVEPRSCWDQRWQWLRQSCVQEAWHVLFHKPIP